MARAGQAKGAEISEVQKGGAAARAGLRPLDRILSINGYPVADSIDLMFHGNDPDLSLMVQRGQKVAEVTVHTGAGEGPGDGLGLTLTPFKIKTCRNKCVFCFVSQLPRGLRRTLYVKDEDYRMSFLYGNYITLTNLTQADKERIAEQRLSPLYISVHATDPEVRRLMLGNPGATDVLRELKFFADNKIRMHTQIVLCPGLNDAGVLDKTIKDLYRFYPYIMSIAVVPVGLTSHRETRMRPMGEAEAADALARISKAQVRFKRKHGECLVFGSDELYIKAGSAFPPLSQYGDLPQLENGVGLVPLFMDLAGAEARRLKSLDLAGGKRFVTFTGVSFFPYLSRFAERLNKAGADLKTVQVTNSFFGDSVTVAGLLTGRDVIKAMSGVLEKDDTLLVPDIVMREGDRIFLDDVSLKDLQKSLGVRVVLIESTPEGLVDAISRQ